MRICTILICLQLRDEAQFWLEFMDKEMYKMAGCRKMSLDEWKYAHSVKIVSVKPKINNMKVSLGQEEMSVLKFRF